MKHSAKTLFCAGLALAALTPIHAESVDPTTLNWGDYLDPESPETSQWYMRQFLSFSYYELDDDWMTVAKVSGLIRRNDMPNVYDRNSFLYYFEETSRDRNFMSQRFMSSCEWLVTYFDLMKANPDMVLIDLGADPVYLTEINPNVFSGWLKVTHKIWRTDHPSFAHFATLRSNDEVLAPLAYAAIDFGRITTTTGHIEIHEQVAYARNFGYYFTPLNEAGECLPREKGWKYSPLHHWFFVDGAAPWTYWHGLDGAWFLSHPTYHPYMFHFNSGEWIYYLEGTAYPNRWFWSPARGWLPEAEL